MAKNKHKIVNCGQKMILFGRPKEGKARRAGQRAMMASRNVVFALTSHTKVQARISTRTKARERTKKEKAMKVFILNPDSQPLKHPMKKDMAIPGNRMTGLSASGSTILRLQLLDGLARELTLRGWWHPL